MNKIIPLCISVLLGLCPVWSNALAGFAGSSMVINVDFEGDLGGTGNVALGPLAPGSHSGSDGVLSTGGTVWNDVLVFPNTQENLVDEFGGATPVDITLSSPLDTYSGATAQNNLQDSGIAATSRFDLRQEQQRAAGGELSPTTILLSDLVSSAVYELAVYISSGRVEGNFVEVLGSGPTTSMSQSALTSYLLPGTPGGDFLLFTGLIPLDIGGGSGELRIQLPDLGEVPTFVAGLQLSVVPEPSVAGLLVFGGFALWFRRRRR